MLVIPVFVVYPLFIGFSYSFGTPEAARAAWTNLTPFRQLAVFFLSDGESQTQNKAKNAYARVIMVIMQ